MTLEDKYIAVYRWYMQHRTELINKAKKWCECYDAEELVESAFIKVLNAQQKNDPPKDMKSYFWTVIKSRFIDSKVQSKRYIDAEASEICAEVAEEPDSNFRDEKIWVFYTALCDIVDKEYPGPDVDKFIFFVWSRSIITGSKLSARKIGKMCNVSASTVYRRVDDIKAWVNQHKGILALKGEIDND